MVVGYAGRGCCGCGARAMEEGRVGRGSAMGDSALGTEARRSFCGAEAEVWMEDYCLLKRDSRSQGFDHRLEGKDSRSAQEREQACYLIHYGFNRDKNIYIFFLKSGARETDPSGSGIALHDGTQNVRGSSSSSPKGPCLASNPPSRECILCPRSHVSFTTPFSIFP